jgi:hypothetical protein
MNKNINLILGIGFATLLILLICLWLVNASNYSEFVETQRIENIRIKKIKSHDLYTLERIKKTDSTFVVNIADLEDANERFEELFLYVDNNTNRAESLINKDLDRMNLYMGIGIGFIGIIGIFVPILINIISVQDLREKLNEMPAIKDINEALENSNKALVQSETVNQLSQDIESLNSDYNEKVPHVTSFILQNAIGRFFNMSPLVMTRMARQNDKNYFIGLLLTVKNAFKTCAEDDKHKIFDNQFLKDTIRDFAEYITSPVMHTVNFSQNEIELFFQLAEDLVELSSSSSFEEEDSRVGTVNNSIENIIDAIQARV